MDPMQRKRNTEAWLQREEIPFLLSLPPVGAEDEVRLRSARDTGIRIVCLFCVAGSASDISDPIFKDYARQHDLWAHLTPLEQTFLSAPEPARHDIIQFSWRTEALFFLLWATKNINVLPLPREQSDSADIVKVMPEGDESPWPFIEGLNLRSTSEILDASDLIYRLHWAVREHRLSGRPAPSGLDMGIIQEWHQAVNWLTRYDDEEWDDVVTDT